MAKARSRIKKGKKSNPQVNQYDKIFRENLEAALPGLIRNLLGIHAVHTEELPDDKNACNLSRKKERKFSLRTFCSILNFQSPKSPL